MTDQTVRPEGVASTTRVGVPTVSLSERADELQLTTPFRERYAWGVLGLFALSLASTLFLVGALVAVDHWFLWRGLIEPVDRIVDAGVVKTMIGATVVQLGAAFAAIVYALFKREQAEADPTD